MARKKNTQPVREQMRLIPETAPEWEDRLVPLDYLPMVYEEPPKGLVDSIRQFGVLMPIIAQEDGSVTRLKLLAGRRRTAAARKAGLEAIPSRVLMGSVGDINPDVLTLIENAERGPNVAYEAQAVKRLMEDGHSAKDIAKATGMPLTVVKKRQVFAALPDSVLNALEDNAISPGVAERLAKLPPAKRGDLVEGLERGTKITGDMVDQAKHVHASGALQSALTAIGGMGGTLIAQVTPQARYERALVHLERFLLEVPEDAPTGLTAAFTALRDEAMGALTAARKGYGHDEAPNPDDLADLPDDLDGGPDATASPADPATEGADSGQ